MATVDLEQVDKTFDDGTRAVRELSLQIEDGELVVLLGPSGCGKSTVLRLLAGLDAPTGGTVRIGGERVNEQGPKARNCAMVFQNYALYPHMTVRRNLEFPLKMARVRRAERERRVQEAARTLGLEGLLERRPAALSGGQRQRVAMGRAIVRDPNVFLMDEPLSNLDAKMRVEIRGEIAALQQRLGTTTVYVTHDQVEAMTLGHRVAVLRDGALQQVAAPRALYERPANLFVAGFLGSPPMNLFRVESERDTLVFGAHRLSLTGPPPEGAVWAGLRPEDLHWAGDWPKVREVEVEASAVEVLGSEQVVYFAAPMETVDADRWPDAGVVRSGRGRLAARLSAKRPAVAGDRLRLAVDTARLYWFDADGSAL